MAHFFDFLAVWLQKTSGLFRSFFLQERKIFYLYKTENLFYSFTNLSEKNLAVFIGNNGPAAEVVLQDVVELVYFFYSQHNLVYSAKIRVFCFAHSIMQKTRADSTEPDQAMAYFHLTNTSLPLPILLLHSKNAMCQLVCRSYKKSPPSFFR